MWKSSMCQNPPQSIQQNIKYFDIDCQGLSFKISWGKSVLRSTLNRAEWVYKLMKISGLSKNSVHSPKKFENSSSPMQG